MLDATRLEFSDGLNCIIGGRGTGKTTALEFIRYILGMMPDAADSRPRSKAIEGHVRGNLGSGTIHLEVETRHGTRYRAERPWGDDLQVLDSDGEPIPVSLDRDLVFKADIYSQNEIEEIATNPRFQLSLIDKFAEESIREASADIQKAKRSIEQSSLDLRNLDYRIREIEDVIPEIEVVGKRLQEMQVVECDLVLIDEAHLIPRASDTMYRRFLDTLSRINPKLKVIGFTATPIRHHAQDVADELQRGGLAGAAAADDAIEAVAELQPRAVEKTAGHRQAEDPVVRRAGVLIVSSGADVASRQLSHLPFLLSEWRDRACWISCAANSTHRFVL